MLTHESGFVFNHHTTATFQEVTAHPVLDTTDNAARKLIDVAFVNAEI